MNTVSNICPNSISRGCSTLSARWLTNRAYNPPQKEKLNGVMNTASPVDMAVSVTDSSVLARDSDDMKLEMLPPGQAATSIMPMATIGGSRR